MLEKTGRTTFSAGGSDAPLTIRRIDAIPVALPLKAPMKMAGETITAAQNILVRIEASDGTVGWGEAASAPTMTGDTLGGLIAAVRDYLAPRADRPGRTAMARAAARRAPRAARQRRRAFRGRDGGARSDRPRSRASA